MPDFLTDARLTWSKFSFQSDAITSAQEVEKLNAQFAATVEQLKNTVGNKVSIGTKDVFVSISNGKPTSS